MENSKASKVLILRNPARLPYAGRDRRDPLAAPRSRQYIPLNYASDAQHGHRARPVISLEASRALLGAKRPSTRESLRVGTSSTKAERGGNSEPQLSSSGTKVFTILFVAQSGRSLGTIRGESRGGDLGPPPGSQRGPGGGDSLSAGGSSTPIAERRRAGARQY